MDSLSEMMLLGIPKYTQTCLNNKFVASHPFMVFLQGMRMHIFLNLPTTKNKYSFPFHIIGKPPTKSMEMISQGRVGRGIEWYRPFFLLLGLSVQQRINPLIYRATYSYILGQYTYLYKLEIVSPTPQCPTTLEV
jgi:hypothetical protein